MQHNPGLTLLNLVCCNDHPIDNIISQILSHVPTSRILLMAYRADDRRLLSAFKHGAMGCLLGDSTPQEICQAVRVLINGGSYLPLKIGQRILQGQPAPSVEKQRNPHDLSSRQIMVLRLVSQDLPNQKIAEQLKISKRTAEMHIYKIFKRLKINNRTQALQAAVRYGILEIDWSSDSQSLRDDSGPDRMS